MPKLQRLLESVSGVIESVYFDPAKSFLPHIFAENGLGDMSVYACASDFDVDLFRKAIPFQAAADGYFRSVFASEAWMATYARGGGRIMPSKHPARQEVVTFRALDLSQRPPRELHAYRVIDRDAATARLLPLVVSRAFGGYFPAAKAAPARRGGP